MRRAARHTSGVGVFRGDRLTHLAPPAHLVSHQVDTLLRWLRRPRTSTLVAGCVAHAELLFIHPFSDGNGRLARLWQQVVHQGHSQLLRFIPVESVIRERQRAYSAALRRSDHEGSCTSFLEFSLEALAEALDGFGMEVRGPVETPASRLELAARELAGAWFTRAEYLRRFPRLSTATASRDLSSGVLDGRLERLGARRLTRYRFRDGFSCPRLARCAEPGLRPVA